MSLFSELRRRNVIRIAGFYLVAAWLIVQVAGTVLPMFEAPAWIARVLVVLLAIGFVPAVAFAWVYELTPDGLRRDRGTAPDDAGDRRTTDRTARKLDIAVIAMLCLVAGLVLWQQTRGPGDAPIAEAAAPASTAPAAADAPATPAVAADSIAVLAFADMSPDGANEYLGDGIAEEILNALAKIDGLKVAGRTSSFRYKGQNVDLRDVGAALGVAHVLEGSVRRQGDQVRITAQLIRAADGFHLWSETYPGTMDDVFALQENIARAVAGELKIRLTGAQAAKLVDAGTTNAEAYALYLQASMIFHRRQGPRMPDAEKMLLRAVELDPRFARAWARVASMRSIARNYQIIDPRDETAGVEDAAHRAIALDPTLAEPYAAMGTQYGAIRDFVRQRDAFAKALALDPDDVIANVWNGTALATSGYRERAHAAFDRALEIDPLLPIALLWRGTGHVTAGEVETGERQLKLAEDGGLAFAGLGLGQLEASRGDIDAASAHMATALHALASEIPEETIAVFARAVAGDPTARAPALAEVDALLSERTGIVPAIAVYVLLALGETDRGFALVGPAPTSNDALVFGSLHRGVFPGALTSPRFPALAREIGWTALWDLEGAPDVCRKVDDDWVCGETGLAATR